MITSTDNEKVKNVIKLQTKKSERNKQGLFVVEGAKMIKEAPASYIVQIFCTRDFADRNNEIFSEKGMVPEIVSDKVFQKMSDTQTPQGGLALIRQSNTDPETIIKENGLVSPLLIFLEDIRDPGNLGTIVRTAEAAGVTGIVMSANTADIYNPKTVRSTMGSIYRVPFYYSPDFCGDIKKAKENGIIFFATSLKAQGSYDAYDYKKSAAFIMGNEAAGISEEALALSDVPIIIPMCGKVESLNVAMATGLLCFEAARQRRKA